MRNAFVTALTSLCSREKNVYLMTGDLGFGVLDNFAKAFPEQFINAGISEQNMASVASGLALAGNIVFTWSIGNFPSLRCIEQLRNNAAYHNANVKVVSIGSGVAYGPLGMTHHSTEDLSMMRALPCTTVFSPSDPYEAGLCCEAAHNTPGLCYIRLGKGGEQNLPSAPISSLFAPRQIRDRESPDCILSTGAISDEALKLADMTKSAFYVFPVVKPIDSEFISLIARRHSRIITIEENNIIGGFGGAVSEIVAEMSGQRASVKRIGFPDVFTEKIGSRRWILDNYGLSAQEVLKTI